MDPMTPPAAGLRPPTMVDLIYLRQPRLMVETLRTGAIPAELFTIFAARFWTVCEDEASLSPKKSSGLGIQSFLTQMASGVDPIPGLERVTLVG